ncbi:NADP-dependent oxidoreductase domain-containing protein [Aspergillus floccosus]
MTNNMIKLIYGGFFSKNQGATPEKVREILDYLEEEGISTIDTAEVYFESEELLGEAGAAARFTVDTKVGGGLSQLEATEENVVTSVEASLQKLKTTCVDVLYIHCPDRRVPIKTTLAGINALYKSGKFKRFGLSNFPGNEIEEVIQVAKENNYVLPSVYQGNYNAVARRTETEIMPILRKWNISFYAYSPIAGGFLTKTPAQLIAGVQGRWDPSRWAGKMYNALYNTPCMLRALEKFVSLSHDTGISQAELAYRWVAYHSLLRPELGDGIIFGARFGPQMDETLKGLRKGPLSADVAERINALWEDIDESPLDNFEGYISVSHG